MNLRMGHGYDAHRWVEGRPLILGGVEIPFHKGLLGHSDADALLHAVCDAILGALALGDIGHHFPDKDPRFRGISSLILLETTARMAMENGWEVVNLDTTILAQRPMLAPHIPEMTRKIAKTLGVQESSVSVKATTTEGMGFVGREEGLAAHAVVLLQRIPEASGNDSRTVGYIPTCR